MYHYSTTFTDSATTDKMWTMTSKEKQDKMLAEMLSIIKKKPGIRPREIHKIMGIEHSASLRNTLIKRGLVRRERKGAAVHYYPR